MESAMRDYDPKQYSELLVRRSWVSQILGRTSQEWLRYKIILVWGQPWVIVIQKNT